MSLTHEDVEMMMAQASRCLAQREPIVWGGRALQETRKILASMAYQRGRDDVMREVEAGQHHAFCPGGSAASMAYQRGRDDVMREVEAGGQHHAFCPGGGAPIGPRLAAHPGYELLAAELDGALAQAQTGKGAARHAAAGEPFHDQQIVQFGVWLGSSHFEIGQCAKKAIESARLPPELAIDELRGAINYAVAAIILRRQELARAPGTATEPPTDVSCDP